MTTKSPVRTRRWLLPISILRVADVSTDTTQNGRAISGRVVNLKRKHAIIQNTRGINFSDGSNRATAK